MIDFIKLLHKIYAFLRECSLDTWSLQIFLKVADFADKNVSYKNNANSENSRVESKQSNIKNENSES